MPFNETYWESAKQSKQDTFGVYMRQMANLLQVSHLEDEPEDTTPEPIAVSEETLEVQRALQDAYKDFQVTASHIVFWGRNWTKEDIIFLQELYADYAKQYATDTPVQINIYKNIAKTQLQANKALERGDVAGYQKMMKVLSDLHNDGNIKPIQDTGAAEEKGTFGQFIARIEQTEPIPEASEEFRDVDGIGKYIEKHFFSHMKRMFGIGGDADGL